jgi:hypothetical protein
MVGDSNDPRRQEPISIKWLNRGLIGRLLVGGEFWGAVEWSPKRNAWCVEDACGRCLTHQASICGQAEARDAAVKLARTMIRDGRMPSPEEAKRLHGDQVETCATTIPAIMKSVTFALGVADARAGRGYHRDYDLWDTNGEWAYERGRMWAALAPRDLSLKLNGKINPDAVPYFTGEII